MSRTLLCPRVLGPLLVALLLVGPFPVAPAVAVSTGGSAPAAAPGVVGTVTNATDNTTDETGDTVDDTTNSTEDTVDDTTDGTTDEVTNETEDTVDDTTNETGDAVDDATNATGDAVDGATNATGDAVDGATNGSVRVDADAAGAATTGSGTNGTTTDRTSAGETTPAGSDASARRTTDAAAAPDGSTDRGWPGSDVDGATAGGAVAVAAGAVAAGLFARGTLGAGTGAVDRGVAGTVRSMARSVRTAGLRETASAWGRWLLGVVGYSRYDHSDPLAHDLRAEVYDAIRASPGTYPAQLDEQVDGSFSTLRHHLDVLDREGLVASATIRGRRRYFPVGTDNRAFEAAINDEPSAAVLDALARHGPASVSEVAERLDRDPSTASHHLARLADDGLVVRERDGRAVTNRLEPEIAAVLDRRRRDPAAGDDD